MESNAYDAFDNDGGYHRGAIYNAELSTVEVTKELTACVVTGDFFH